MGEYAYKINDPSTANNFIYKPGECLLLSGTYSQRGLGIMVSAKRVDNMDYRSNRAATGSALAINYIPAITKIHTYNLSAYYPYATQPNGEMGLQAEVLYKFKKQYLHFFILVIAIISIVLGEIYIIVNLIAKGKSIISCF